MRNLGMALLIGLGVTANASHASDSDLEIWLLEGSDCGSCDLYRTFHQGYPKQLTGYSGADSPIPVSVVRKTAIPKDIAEQFTPHDYWPHSLSVMVLDDETVLYVAHISEASDIADARFPKAIMAPATDAERERSKHSSQVYTEHFEATWNLDYFLDVALARCEPYASMEEAMLGQTGRLDNVARNNVILWGSASRPFGNSLFISERMHHIHQTLEQVAGPTLNFITLYGNGDDPQPDTSTLMDGGLRYIHAAVQPAKDAVLSPNAATMGRLFHSLQNTRDNLLVQVGHSGPTGAPLWGHLATIQLAEDHGSGEEQWAVRTFIGQVPATALITTTDALAINHEALQKVADMTEASSTERNARMALEYPLVLSSLARRLIWRSRGTPSEASKGVARCADQTISEFLQGTNAAR